jgi:hypothetical protein
MGIGLKHDAGRAATRGDPAATPDPGSIVHVAICMSTYLATVGVACVPLQGTTTSK